MSTAKLKVTEKEAYEKGYQDGRYGGHDTRFWESLTKPKRKAYDRGYVSGTKSPIRC